MEDSYILLRRNNPGKITVTINKPKNNNNNKVNWGKIFADLPRGSSEKLGKMP